MQEDLNKIKSMSNNHFIGIISEEEIQYFSTIKIKLLKSQEKV
jgi:hypothetical protein